MKIKGIKRGQIIELLEQINNIPDGTEIIVDVVISANQIVETAQTLSDDEKLSKLNQLFGAWQNQPELVEIFTEIDEQRHVYRGRVIDSIENKDKK
ncbi:hypothetical protein [Brunnivagina elsteri]|uniref:Uncharacterized protein n=1 Tax=Brunnivagina elsteri CCALA 953 TaxID=987040 RepID=A0A2A2TKN7_9CYAN|nr:hypothetical protein [Calothrix elsteri]PAX57147.1 hypothetical protein CK510_09255 [Calothrix elsteri CCALA 953]